jgi:selenocysteine lyase/cysteine desulfurase
MLAPQRHLFDVPRDVAYLNNASYTPLPHAVREAGEAGVAAKSMPWLMQADASHQDAEAVRAAAASFIGATADDIALVPSVAYGVATAAANLAVPSGSRILLVDGEFPSQSLAWARQVQLRGATLDIVAKPADGDWTAALLARIRQPGLPPIAVAALTPLHWTDGTLIDIARLVPSLRDQGAAIVVDATQAAGILPLDVATLGADYLVFPTYKWVLGPYTLAFLYAAPHRQNGTPLERHGANHVGGAAPFTGSLGSPIPTARRYDMGERLNPVSLPMALAGMTLLRQWGRDPVAARLRHLTNLLATEAESCGWTPVPRALRPPHILGLRPPAGVSTDAALASLAEQGVYVAERGGVMRLGAHVYNDDADVARFATALRQIRPD